MKRITNLTKEILELFKEKYAGKIFQVDDLQALYDETEEGYAEEEFLGLCSYIDEALKDFNQIYKDPNELATIIRYEFTGCFHDCVEIDKETYLNFAIDILSLIK